MIRIARLKGCTSPTRQCRTCMKGVSFQILCANLIMIKRLFIVLLIKLKILWWKVFRQWISSVFLNLCVIISCLDVILLAMISRIFFYWKLMIRLGWFNIRLMKLCSSKCLKLFLAKGILIRGKRNLTFGSS